MAELIMCFLFPFHMSKHAFTVDATHLSKKKKKRKRHAASLCIGNLEESPLFEERWWHSLSDASSKMHTAAITGTSARPSFCKKPIYPAQLMGQIFIISPYKKQVLIFQKGMNAA